MSQRQFPIRRSSKRSRQKPHSQKSAVSAKNPLAQKKEADYLQNKLKDLRRRTDMAFQATDRYWKMAKEFEAQERMDMALQAKTMYEKEADNYKFYNSKISKIKERLRQLSVVQIRLIMRENYAMMKMEEGPSDYSD